MKQIGNISEEDTKKEYLTIDVEEELLKGSINYGEKEITFDFSKLLELKNVNIETVSVGLIDNYLNYITSLNYTLDGIISNIEKDLNKITLERDIWNAKCKEAAKKEMMDESFQQVNEGKITKSFITEPSKDKLLDRVMIKYSEEYIHYITIITDLETKKEFFKSLLTSTQQSAMCLMNIVNRRKI